MRFNLLVDSARFLLAIGVMAYAQSNDFPSSFPPYDVSNTNTARENTALGSIFVCPGTVLEFTMCDTYYSGDPFLRLMRGGEFGVEVANNDDSCSIASKMTYSFTDNSCQSYTLKMGCYASGGCQGQVVVKDLSPKPSESPTLAPFYYNLPEFLPRYDVSDTDSATQNTADYPIYGCPGYSVTLSLCGDGAECTNDPYLRVVNKEGSLIAANDDSCGICSAVSITFTGSCQVYTLKQGCYSGGSCGGKIKVTSSNFNPTPGPTGPPIDTPTPGMTDSPTAVSTDTPITTTPSVAPSDPPFATPSAIPSTEVPTIFPTAPPTTQRPSTNPTASPTTQSPTVSPTAIPSDAPVADPTFTPTASPTAIPSDAPVPNPTLTPTATPTSDYHCDPYSTTVDNWISCGGHVLCPGEYFIASTCHDDNKSCDGDTFLKIEDANGFVLDNDDRCGKCSRIWFQLTGVSCKTFTVQQGCATGACSGQTKISVVTDLENWTEGYIPSIEG